MWIAPYHATARPHREQKQAAIEGREPPATRVNRYRRRHRVVPHSPDGPPGPPRDAGRDSRSSSRARADASVVERELRDVGAPSPSLLEAIDAAPSRHAAADARPVEAHAPHAERPLREGARWRGARGVVSGARRRRVARRGLSARRRVLARLDRLAPRARVAHLPRERDARARPRLPPRPRAPLPRAARRRARRVPLAARGRSRSVARGPRRRVGGRRAHVVDAGGAARRASPAPRPRCSSRRGSTSKRAARR